MDIKNISPLGKTPYYALYKNGKYERYIGNKEKLDAFLRDTQIGNQASNLLLEKPYLNPKAGLGIIASAKKDEVKKFVVPKEQYQKYHTIVIDPPWPMEKILRDERPNQTDFDYPTMEIDEIIKFPTIEYANPDGCHIYLWTTQRFLPDAFKVMSEWGFNYQCLMTWVKNVGFTPFSWMYSIEHCLFGRAGTLPLTRLGMRLDFQAKVREHSRKPDEFYELVRQASPEPRIDIFSREKRQGFDQAGNETGKFGG